MLKLFVVAVALACTGLAQGQTPTQAPASAAKKELVAKLLQLIQPAVEGMAQQLAQQPAAQVQQGAGQALQRVSAERREALARDIEADLRKYVEEAVPLVRERAVKMAPQTIGPLLEERFTEDELRQIVAILESPANRKFQQAFPDMQRALGEKLIAETRGDIEPKVKALAQAVEKRLAPPAPAATPAATPAKKP